MPSSDPHGKPWAADIYAVVRPRMVLDLGPGEGTWAAALRPRWAGRWTAVEVWQPYIDAYGLRDRYDEVVCADLRHYIDGMTPLDVDLVIAGDVLEHLPREDAERIVSAVRSSGCHMLVSVPVVPCWQGPVNGNEHETHLWSPDHEWAMATLEPAAWTVGDIVGVYWSAP